jgi:flagellar basal body L-ring protein FlgH
MIRLSGIVVVLLVALTGCAEVGVRDLPPERVYVPVGTPVQEAADGSIFSRAGQDSLLGQDRARRAGDLLTILIDEQVSASTSARSIADSAMPGCPGRWISIRAKARSIPRVRAVLHSRAASPVR